MKFLLLLYLLSIFVIFWANIGYPLSILIIGKITNKQNEKNKGYRPSVTVMVVAHNEENVILNKLMNLSELDYPKDKIEFLVSSDNSNDMTNRIVEDYISNNKEIKIQLYKVKKRKGKTNAQNEAQKLVKTEILIMTDANSMLKKDSVKELVSSFSSEEISYVTGRLIYINSNENKTADLENTYWDLDIKIREIESNIQTITAGNGALYACRNKDYFDFNPIKSHDSSMPLYYGLNKKRAIANHDAIAYEKAGENVKDEFNRKVRMNRILLSHILPNLKILNIFKYKWFTFFYLGHRTSRYLLWISHIILFTSNIFLLNISWWFLMTMIIQLAVYFLAFLGEQKLLNSRIINICHYYSITIFAQIVGVYRTITGKAKPSWEKAESTR